jgi:hypothetical protein
MPGTAVPVPAGAQTVGIDVRAVIRDDAGRTVGHLRDTLQVPAGSAATLAGTQVMYQSGVILPAGRFSIKVVARENTSGVVGSFEAPLVVPTLEDAPVKLSSIVFSTQLGARPAGEASAYERLELVPNLTHVVTSDQTIRFYYEVYDPATSARAMHLRTSLSFFRGTVKVYETALAERTVLDDPTRGAAVFRFEIPGRTLTPGTYICQVSVIDSVSEHVAFARLSFVVSPG